MYLQKWTGFYADMSRWIINPMYLQKWTGFYAAMSRWIINSLYLWSNILQFNEQVNTQLVINVLIN